MGVASLSVFGSIARGESESSSDIDMATTFAEDSCIGMLAFSTIAVRLRELVDLIGEPATKRRCSARSIGIGCVSCEREVRRLADIIANIDTIQDYVGDLDAAA